MNFFLYLNLIIASTLVIGCSDFAAPEHKKQIDELQKKCSELQSKAIMLEYYKFRINDLNKRIIKLEARQYDEVYLDLSSKGYQRLDTSSGFFLVSLDNVKPYANGYKFFLRIGNISIAKYKGFKLKLKYGRQFDSKEMDEDISAFDNWEKSLRFKEISFTNELDPGVWNRVEVIISPAKSEELGYIVLSMETNILSLLEQRK